MRSANDSQIGTYGKLGGTAIDSFRPSRIIERIMNKSAKLAELRHFMARYGLPPERVPIPLGEAGADTVLGGGLKPGALHEVLAQGWSAGGFAAGLAILATDTKPLFWVRPD